MSPQHKKAKRNTIGVARRTIVKLPHYMGPVLTYPMENLMLFVHHAIKWWGCNYTIEDDKGLNERT